MASVEQQAPDEAAVNGTNGSAGSIPVENPATGEVIATVPDLQRRRGRARWPPRPRQAQPGWEALGFEGRGADPAARAEVDRRQRATASSTRSSSETGKTYEDAQLAELSYGADAFGFWAKNAPEVPRRREGQARSTCSSRARSSMVRYAPARRRRRHRPVELPADQLVRRLHPGARRRQRRGPQAERAHAADLAADGRVPATSAGCPRASSRSPPAAARPARALIDEVDMIMFTGSTATGKKVDVRGGRAPDPGARSSSAARTR